jgi:NIPSNAP
MILELRFYQVTQGRIADQNARLTNYLVPKLFPRHGVKCVGAWNSIAGPVGPRFVYLMAFEDFAQRERAWSGFYADPEWAAVRSLTNAGHEMVERHDLFFIRPNPVQMNSAMQAMTSQPGEIHELVMQQIAPGQTAQANNYLRETLLPRLHSHGARTQGVFDIVSGSSMQQVLMFHAWPDASTWHRGRLETEKALDVLQALTEQRTQLGQPIFGRAEVSLLAPVEGFEIRPTLGS